VISQEVVNWGSEELTDCFTLFSAAEESQSGLTFPTLYNRQFMLEAQIINSAQAMYSSSQIRDHAVRGSNSDPLLSRGCGGFFQFGRAKHWGGLTGVSSIMARVMRRTRLQKALDIVSKD
jgi:hypothetical protein